MASQFNDINVVNYNNSSNGFHHSRPDFFYSSKDRSKRVEPVCYYFLDLPVANNFIMQSIAFELEAVIDQHIAALQAILKEKMSYKPSPSKWSKKEIIGHMIDSAQNNIRRFIVAQYEENPTIVYKQDNWVALSNYQNADITNLIQLWYLLNKHIAIILKNMQPEMMQRKCQTESSHTIEWLAQDYLRHLRHHLHQVLDIDPVPYP